MAVIIDGSAGITTPGETNTGNLSVAGSTTLTTPLPVASGGTGGSATPTAGGVVYGTGSVQAVTTAGTSGQVLQSNGASAPTWVTPSAGAITLISTQTSSSNTSVSWTGLTGYNNYLLVASGIDFSGIDFLALEFGTGGTPTYVTTGYYNSITAVDIGSTTIVNRYGISNYSYAMLNSPNQSILKTNCVCYIFGMTNSNNTTLSFQSNGVTSVPAYGSYVGQSTLTNTTAKTAIRISGGNSNTFSGTLSLYGISS